MARKVKNDYIGGRVDEDLKERVEAYIDEADMTMGELIRAATEEYIDNHSVTEETSVPPHLRKA